MEKLRIVECKGYTKNDAFKDLNFSPNRVSVKGSNATQAWIRAGKPLPGTIAFKTFAIQQLEEKTRNEPGTGLHIVIQSPIPDIRKRPYTLVNVSAEGTRQWKFIYQIREDVLDRTTLPTGTVNDDGEYVTDSEKVSIDIAEIGKVVAECETKAKALALAKEYTATNKRDYTVIPVKIPDLAPVAAYCIYTPSARAKEGVFIAFGYDCKD